MTLKQILFSIFFIPFIFCSCGKDTIITADITPTPTGEAPAPDTGTTPVLAAIDLQASRDYNPSSWNHDSTTSNQDGDFTVPTQLNVTAGNSGTGWASLTIGTRKFCFQGNASNNNTANGTVFNLHHEKSNTATSCSSGGHRIAFDQAISLSSGVSILLEINGGGCSNSGGTCVYTEAEITLTPVTQ